MVLKPRLMGYLLTTAFLTQPTVALRHRYAILPIIDNWLNSHVQHGSEK